MLVMKTMMTNLTCIYHDELKAMEDLRSIRVHGGRKVGWVKGSYSSQSTELPHSCIYSYNKHFIYLNT